MVNQENFRVRLTHTLILHSSFCKIQIAYYKMTWDFGTWTYDTFPPLEIHLTNNFNKPTYCWNYILKIYCGLGGSLIFFAHSTQCPRKIVFRHFILNSDECTCNMSPFTLNPRDGRISRLDCCFQLQWLEWVVLFFATFSYLFFSYIFT